MKFAFALFIIFVSLSTLAAPLELTFKDHFESPKVVLHDTLLELIRIKPDFDLQARMIAGTKSKKKSGVWGEGLREKLQGSGTIIRL